MLNSVRYPAVDYQLNFTQNKFSRACRDASIFRKEFYGLGDLMSSPGVSPSDYKTLSPLFVFDVTKQSERLKASVTDIQVKAQFSANVAANTEAFAVVISDKKMLFKSDGQKLAVDF